MMLSVYILVGLVLAVKASCQGRDLGTSAIPLGSSPTWDKLTFNFDEELVCII